MDLIFPTWMDFLDLIIYNNFGYYSDSESIFHLRQQCMYILHIIALDTEFYDLGGMEQISEFSYFDIKFRVLIINKILMKYFFLFIPFYRRVPVYK